MKPLLIGAAHPGTAAIIVGFIILALIGVGIVSVIYMTGRGAKKVVDAATHHNEHPSGS
jgi:hypothetical protein